MEKLLEEALELLREAPVMLIELKAIQDKELLESYLEYLRRCATHKHKLVDLMQRAGYGEAT